MSQNPTCADHILAILECLPFNLNVRIRRHVRNKNDPDSTSAGSALVYLTEESSLASVRNKNDPYSTSVVSALVYLTEESNFGSDSEWIPVRVGLELIQTFLTFVLEWSNTSEAVQRGDDAKHHLEVVRSSLLQKIELFKPRIKEAYDFFEHAFETGSFPVIKSDDVWVRLCDCTRTNASHLNSETHLITTALFVKVKYLLTGVQVFREPFLNKSSDRQSSWDLGIRMEGLAICLARLLFSWWADGTDKETDQTAMLSDLLQSIKPTSPELLGAYVKAITNQAHCPTGELASHLVRIILIPSNFESLETFLESGLVSLILYLIKTLDTYATDEDVELLYSDIEKKVCDAGSLIQLHDGKIVLLLQKIELSKLESTLLTLTSSAWIIERKIESIHQGLRLLQTLLLKYPKDVNTEKLIMIIKRIELVATETESLQLELGAKQIDKSSHHDALKYKLFLDFRLVKIQAYLLEQRMIILPPEKNLKAVEIVDEMETPLRHFSRSNQQVPENTIDEMSTILSDLLELVNICNTDTRDSYLQLQNSSALTLPETTPDQGLSSVDNFLEKLSGLVKDKNDWIGYSMKGQTEAVLKELSSVTSFMEDVGGEKTKRELRGEKSPETCLAGSL
ncbi:OLC1v1032364C1 [Oldenlandia corymbosa var. corymbosa]|uniref:OLC1v1032364C1 n=1 Tax=Oldenlandia corymbosa var. corymbosa TaxID=529605 RepID=A0AAV1CL12_OLDCO|nr:OLC1v1032364C1 [Oldenlandia corymbosa var. corymbosa]